MLNVLGYETCSKSGNTAWICRYGMLSSYSIGRFPVSLRTGDYVVVLPDIDYAHDPKLSSVWVRMLVQHVGNISRDMLAVALTASPADVFLRVN